MKGHEEIIGIPAAILGAVAPYIKTLSEVAQLVAVLLGCGVAFVTLIIKIKQLRKK